MSDLSIPREAAEWACSWLHEAANPTYNSHLYRGDAEIMAHRRERALSRIERAIAELSANPVQRARCHASILTLRNIVRRERAAFKS